MREVVRQYGSMVIAVIVGLMLIALIAHIRVDMGKAMPQSRALTAESNDALGVYWRSQ